MKILPPDCKLDPIEIRCGQCQKTAVQKTLTCCDHTEGHEVEDQYGSSYYEETHTLRLSLCPHCRYINFSAEDHDGGDIFVIYPKPPAELFGLPDNIFRAYRAARAVRDVDPNAFAVLLGRLLEMVCMDRNAVGKSLSLQLKDLSNRGEIPGPLADMANQLRTLRNIGAHATLGELTKSELPILDELCQAILEYVYVAPQRVAVVQKRIDALKKS